MSALFCKGRTAISGFLTTGKKRILFLLFLVAIGVIALLDFYRLEHSRRTFVFYSEIDENTVVEERMLRWSGDKETDMRRYIDEALLGPVSPGSEPLFPREARLNSLMYRDDVVYADLSEPAAMSFREGGDAFKSLLTLNEGIRRNFPYIKNVKLFIGGNEVFFEEFRGIFPNSADISKSSP